MIFCEMAKFFDFFPYKILKKQGIDQKKIGGQRYSFNSCDLS